MKNEVSESYNFFPNTLKRLGTSRVGRGRRHISHPGQLYTPQKMRLEEAFEHSNPYNGSKYHNMYCALSVKRGTSLGDILKRSSQVRSYLKTSLRNQRNRNYLNLTQLPDLPRYNIHPRVVTISTRKTLTKKIDNDAHSSITNGGFGRTVYGGFFMH